MTVPEERRGYHRQNRYVPPPCTSCTHHRQVLLAQGKISKELAENSTFVIKTTAILRYLGCAVCGRDGWKVPRDD